MNFLKKLFCKHDYKQVRQYKDVFKTCDDGFCSYRHELITEFKCSKCGKIKKTYKFLYNT